jgi:hypothetical protein
MDHTLKHDVDNSVFFKIIATLSVIFVIAYFPFIALVLICLFLIVWITIKTAAFSNYLQLLVPVKPEPEDTPPTNIDETVNLVDDDENN